MKLLSIADIDRLERAALAQIDKPIGTPITLMPGELLALCGAARKNAVPAEATPEAEATTA